MGAVVETPTPLPIGQWEVNQWRIKTEQGAKGPNDRKVWVASPGGDYCLLSLASLGAITRAWYVNEAIRYDQPWQRGGEMVLDFLRDCCTQPFEEACLHNKLPAPRVREVR